MFVYIRAVILNDVLVKCLAFDVNVTTVVVAAAIAAAAVAVMASVLDPCTIQMKIHFRTVALPSNVYLGHGRLSTAAADAVATTTNVARPVFCRIIQMICRGSCWSDSVKSPKYFECLF